MKFLSILFLAATCSAFNMVNNNNNLSTSTRKSSSTALFAKRDILRMPTETPMVPYRVCFAFLSKRFWDVSFPKFLQNVLFYSSMYLLFFLFLIMSISPTHNLLFHPKKKTKTMMTHILIATRIRLRSIHRH